MRSILFTGFGVGLLAGVANASPCKPRTTTSDAAQTTTTLAVVATSPSSWAETIVSTVSSYLSETETSSTVVVEPTTTSTATFDTITASDTTEVPTTTEATTTSEAVTTTEATSTTAEIITTAETTTTSEGAGPLATFAAVAANNAVAGAVLRGFPQQPSQAIFDPTDSNAGPYTLTIDPVTNRLRTGTGSNLCAAWNGPTGPNQPGAVSVCDQEYDGHQFITCTQSDDRELSCKAMEEACSYQDDMQMDWGCYWTYRDITQFLIRQDSNGDALYLGFGPVDGYSTVTLKTQEVKELDSKETQASRRLRG